MHNKSYVDLVNLFHTRGLSRTRVILTSFDCSRKSSVIEHPRSLSSFKTESRSDDTSQEQCSFDTKLNCVGLKCHLVTSKFSVAVKVLVVVG